jgi:uncharacterized protein with ParB-like and HNH nuclease domain
MSILSSENKILCSCSESERDSQHYIVMNEFYICLLCNEMAVKCILCSEEKSSTEMCTLQYSSIQFDV